MPYLGDKTLDRSGDQVGFKRRLAYRRKDDNRRLRVEIAICAIASEINIARQSHLRAKMAIHGSASELKRIKIKTCE